MTEIHEITTHLAVNKDAIKRDTTVADATVVFFFNPLLYFIKKIMGHESCKM